MRHPSLEEWESRLRKVLGRIDDAIEDAYGNRYKLHPARAPRGTTASEEHDGLFKVEAKFTTGYGSRYGRGYIVDVRIVTLDRVPKRVRKEIEDKVAAQLRAELPKAFPKASLQVDRDGSIYKIHGDLSLGEV